MPLHLCYTDDGFAFRDLNKNGVLDPYEDSRLPIEERMENLLAYMTLEEKAGLLVQTIITMNPDGSMSEGGGDFSMEPTTEMVMHKLMNHFNLLFGSDPRHIAEWFNRVQALAEETRLGIPVKWAIPAHSYSSVIA